MEDVSINLEEGGMHSGDEQQNMKQMRQQLIYD